MSAGKPPFDPFGSNERTVVRPNPGGRREAPPAAAPPPPPAFQPPPAYDPWSTGPSTRETAYVPPAGPQQPPPTVRDIGPVPDIRAVSPERVPDVNPILQAARPLLLLLSNLRVSPNSSNIAKLMESVAQAVNGFERELMAAGVPDSKIVAAKYALCSTADDIVQNMPGTERHLWTQYSMLSRFFRERLGGVGFFDELAKIKSNPALNIDLLEFLHACLSLGFEGQYRSASNGNVALQQIRRDVYQTIRHIKQRSVEDISPHWQGQQIAPEHAKLRIPLWAIASSAAATLLGVFILLRLFLSGASDALADKIALLHPDRDVTLSRASFQPLEEVPVDETNQLKRIRAKLKTDIAAKRTAVDPAGEYISVRLLSDNLFDSGSATVKPAFKAVLERIAQTLNDEPNRIKVVGHTDNAPIKASVRFKSNQQLSEKRAEAVALLLRPKLTDPDRLNTEGRGADAPLASNKTKEGRARNRRVDILIPRAD